MMNSVEEQRERYLRFFRRAIPETRDRIYRYNHPYLWHMGFSDSSYDLEEEAQSSTETMLVLDRLYESIIRS